MNNKAKRIMATLLAASSVFAVAGCGGDKDKESSKENENVQLNVVKGLPDYSADEATKTLMIGGYCAPYAENPYVAIDHINVETYQKVREAGLDYVLTLYEQGPATESIQRHLECAGEAGVKVMVRWDAIMSMGSATPETMRKQLESVLDKEAFMGIFAKDEPHAGDLKSLGSASEVYKQVTDKYFYVNLFPNYANVEQLKADSYTDYVNKYCYYVKNNMIIEDHYPFGHIQGSTKYDLNDGFLSNLEVIQRYAKHYNREHWEYMQGESTGNGSKTPDYYDFSLQAYANMCYGVINMQYFCYFSPFPDVAEDMTAFVDAQGNLTPRWHDGKKINDELHAFDHVYLNFANDHRGTMTILGSENIAEVKAEDPEDDYVNSAFEKLTDDIDSTERIKKITATRDAIVGTYKDKDGRDGFTIVNYTVPAYRIKNTIDIEFREADALIYYRHGEYNLAELTNGKFSIELDAGEGIFAIPVKY